MAGTLGLAGGPELVCLILGFNVIWSICLLIQVEFNFGLLCVKNVTHDFYFDS